MAAMSGSVRIPPLRSCLRTIREAEGLLRESDAYTAASVAALQAALERAKAVEGEEYAFGEPYFALQQALKEMKPAGSISVTILGTADRETLLSTAPVDASGSTYLEVLQKASVEYGFSFTPTSQAIVEVSGLYAGEGAGWYLYDGQARVTDLKGKPADGAALTLKYCSDTTRLEQEATPGAAFDRGCGGSSGFGRCLCRDVGLSAAPERRFWDLHCVVVG